MLHHSRSLTALLLLACFSLTACDSGKDEASPQEELTAMFADMQSALTLAFTAGAGKTSMPSVNCPQGGTLDVTASGGSGNTFNQSLKYNNCNGINGSLAMRGSSAFSGQDLTYNVTLNGKGELVGVFPEGFKGIGKPFSERYKLQRFGRGEGIVSR